ncbi:MAG: phosphoenolpyruvate synthase [Myxococcaceae bacterium]
MSHYVLGFEQIDQSQVALAGGKGANLGELSCLEGIRVPPGFCVTTEAFKTVVATLPLGERLEQLNRLSPDDRASIAKQSAEVRAIIEGAVVPPALAAELAQALRAGGRWAVRSSATAEDLPGASFAGQQDTFLEVAAADVPRHLTRCWASLFTDRAVTYRLRNGFDHRKVQMAVVVQQMVPARVSGVLFTADPISGNRKTASIEAVFGLGEALVSGQANPDVYQVRDATLTAQAPRQTLTEGQALELTKLGRVIEAHFGRPQDIEWCLATDGFQFVQSRAITTLFPIPPANDAENHVYVSVGHQQMMTDAMKPFGLSMWQLVTPRPMSEAGGRLFVDITRALSSPAGRAGLLELFAKGDPLLVDALQTVLARDFIRTVPDAGPVAPPIVPGGNLEPDPALVAELISANQASVAALKRDIRGKTGPALFDFILQDLQELRRLLHDRRGHQAFMTAIEAAWWLNEKLFAWLGEKNASDVLTQSVPNNVTSEMGLALLDVADVIRPHRQVVAFLSSAPGDGFLERLDALPGGPESRAAIAGWLEQYGMRCIGEIDITRPRWSERPSTLIPVLLGNIQNFTAGEGKRRFEQGREQAEKKEAELLARLRRLPDGEQKAAETKQMIDRLRTFIGYREYPKYGMVSRYWVYKQALLSEAQRMGLEDPEDLFYLRFDELRAADCELIRQRKEAFKTYQSLTPPRVLTSEGDALSGSYRREVPPGALVGNPVSAGTVEGRARVIRDLANADLQPGDILVTAFTDPSWTPLFVSIRGLVTEVGGQMTHGAVIAREYGLPAVVGVERATQLIRDGQRIRVHGTEGYVELL